MDFLTETITICPNCKSKKVKAWCEGSDKMYEISDYKFLFSRCKECGLVFMSKRPVQEEIHKFYPAEYLPYQTEQEKVSIPKELIPTWIRICTKFINPITRTLWHKSLVKLEQKINEHYKLPCASAVILDYGCGSELFLNRAAALGWKTIGVDFTDSVVERVKKHGHTGYNAKEDFWENIQNETLHLIRLNHVFEHLYKPKETLEIFYRKLVRGGILHISMPNPNSISARLFKSSWIGLDPPRHIMLYTPSLMFKILSECSFEKIVVYKEILTKDFLRSYGLKLYAKKEISHKEAINLHHSPELNALVYPFMHLAALLGMPDQYHIFARKR